KTLPLVFVVIQLRWTLPRLRMDQMMAMCWKYLIPIAFLCIIGTMTWILFIDWQSLAGKAVRMAMAALCAAIVIHYIRRTIFNYRADAEAYRKMTGRSMWYSPIRLP
ncbi:MAG: NADH-quinone oxidoreductase subunit H, partial [Planctomycetes bacterium]|nr:NADH-quinone oxidoreductase subunit H [Planctomycetota bacterium]